MALVSTRVSAGMKILADHFNKLWLDLTQNHDHSSGQGGAVDHADLADSAAMFGVFHTHGDIETHMNGTDESFDDSPGGAQGVHGLGSAAFVAGSIGTLNNDTPAASQLAIIAGYKTCSGTGGAVLFTPLLAGGFSAAPMVLISASAVSGQHSADATKNILVHTVTTTQFEWEQDGALATGFYWVALGVL